MALELRQQLKPTQRLVMAPQLRQAIRLLQLNQLELSNALQAELEQNPALEEDVSQDEIAGSAYGLSSTVENLEPGKEGDFTERVAVSDNLSEINWEDYANNFDSNFSFSHEVPAVHAPSKFDYISAKPGFSAYLQWQLVHAELDDHEWDIAIYIIGNLNRYGFLEVDLDEIMARVECTRNEVEYMLEVIQGLDPPGIATRNVTESLLLQLERLGMADSLAAAIVRNHLPLLEIRNHKALTRATGRKKTEIIKAIEYIIKRLTPYPGLPYAEESTNYIIPDVYVREIDGEYVIHLNDDDLPHLRLSHYYQELLNDKGLQKESRHYIHDKLKNAEWFIKSIHQRQRTIYKVMESLLKFQYEFFEYGPGHLKPLILRDVAEDIDMHESTISRVTSNKYVHTPQGIYKLKFFFSTAISRNGGEAMASESIGNTIFKMIQEEDRSSPLSDNAIAEKLARKNIRIARRTVAKYREQLKILPIKHRRHNR